MGRDESGKSRDESAAGWDESAARACQEVPARLPFAEAGIRLLSKNSLNRPSRRNSGGSRSISLNG
jgi:hypothetical protein